MNVGNSVRKSFKDFFEGDVESAMLHACNAIDGTAKKRYPKLGNKDRFTKLIRDHYDIFGPMALPGIDLRVQRWPVALAKPTAPGGEVDTADLIYGIHRCSHGHGDELPQGFELVPDAFGDAGTTHMVIDTSESSADGKVQLSDRTVFGLLAVAVMAPENHLQRVRDSFCFVFGRDRLPLIVDEWWGRAADFAAVVALDPPAGMEWLVEPRDSTAPISYGSVLYDLSRDGK